MTSTATITTKITATTAKTTKLPKGASEVVVRDTEIKGFALRIYATGGKSYTFAGRIAGAGQRRTVVIGDAYAMPAGEARAAAERLRTDFRAGRDPVAEKEAERQRKTAERAAQVTLSAVAAEYLAAHGVGALPQQKRPPTARGAQSEAQDVNRAMAHLGDVLVGDITTAHARALQSAVSHLAPASRRRIFGGAKRAIDFAVHRELRGDNPFTAVPAPAGSMARSRYLSRAELRAVWEAAGEMGTYGAIIRFLIALPVRRSIASELRFDQIDPEAMTLTVAADAEGNKNRQTWILPLPEIAAEIVRSRPAGEFVFANSYGTGGWTMSGTFKARLDKLAGVTGWQVHDLRRSAATLTADRFDDLDESAFDLLLMHTRQGVAGVYQRSRRFGAMKKAGNQWSAVLAEILGRKDNVVSLAAAG